MNDTPRSPEGVAVSLLRKLDGVDLTPEERGLLRAILRDASNGSAAGETTGNLSFSDEFAAAFTPSTADPPGSGNSTALRSLISRSAPGDEPDQSPGS